MTLTNLMVNFILNGEIINTFKMRTSPECLFLSLLFNIVKGILASVVVRKRNKSFTHWKG